MRAIILILIVSLVQVSCSGEASESKQNTLKVQVAEVYQTERDTLNNVDTPAIYHHPEGGTWLLATAKETDKILVYNAVNGTKKFGMFEEGTGLNQLDRPNSIAVIDNLAIIVERDNRRVQVFGLPEFNSLGVFGDDQLIKPYGLTVFRGSDDSFELYVTDNYETEEEEVPPLPELNKRVHHFNFSIGESGITAVHQKAFGDVTEQGALRVVESLIADPVYDRLMIADEDSIQNHNKIYTLDGTFTGEIVGEGLFKHQTEGIALYECDENTGYWIFTDQSDEDNTFHVFDRVDLTLIGSFQNASTTNTDGIVITQKAFEGFPQGGFFPVHDDGNVSAIKWEAIAEPLGLKTCMQD